MDGLRIFSFARYNATLAVLLLALITSGIPLAEVHAHENATFGHSHSHHYDNDPDPHHGALTTDESTPPAGTSHVHDVNAPALTLIQQIDIDVISIWADSPVPALFPFRPPDNFITPLYRPPIA